MEAMQDELESRRSEVIKYKSMKQLHDSRPPLKVLFDSRERKRQQTTTDGVDGIDDDDSSSQSGRKRFSFDFMKSVLVPAGKYFPSGAPASVVCYFAKDKDKINLKID